jgi:signal transduction histidine kinase
VGGLVDEVGRITRIVENLFALSRLEAGLAQVKHTRLDLASLAVATAEQMCLLAEDKNIGIKTVAPTPVFVEGDPARLKQVIVNLLDNAIKYTPKGGSLTLSVTAAADRALCEVADTGYGIPAEAIPFIFERFYRVDEARSREIDGAGLGLAIVKSICAAHGGVVEVKSVVGQGSRFIVALPLAAPEERNPSGAI